MITGLELYLIKVRDTTINFIKFYLANKPINEIASELKITETEVIEIIDKFKSN